MPTSAYTISLNTTTGRDSERKSYGLHCRALRHENESSHSTLPSAESRLGRSLPRDQTRYPARYFHGLWVRDLSTWFLHIDLVDEPLGCNVSQLVVDRAPKMRRLLAIRNSCSAVGKAPLKDRQSHSLEAMHSAIGVDDKLQRNVVRRATIPKHRLRPNGCSRRRDSRWRERRLFLLFAYKDTLAVCLDDHEVAVCVDRRRLIGLRTR